LPELKGDKGFITVLLAEDGPADRMLLATLVARLGHRVLTAANGLEAVALFEQERPQLVLMDALMPVMDGFEAARRIKRLAGEELVPIIFLTSLSEGEALVQSIEAGGDDFLSKPYNPLILEAKIKAMNRLRRLQATVLEQRDLIARHNGHLLTEQRVAKAVFDKITHSGCLGAANIRYLQSPYALFNGDLLLAAYKPSGEMHVLLGDFTGHGLPAAIGAMPVADAFYSMTARGYSPSEILCELNAKLKRILPVGMFCCATLLSVDTQRRLLEVWNGGLPAGYLRRVADGHYVELASRHLPLGVLENDAFDTSCDVHPLAVGDRVLLLSDGVLEVSNATGETFGEERLRTLLRECDEPARLFAQIQNALADFHGEAHDDASMLEILVSDEPISALPMQEYGKSWLISSQDWSASFEFRAQTLKSFNPLPFLLQLLMEVRGLRPRSGELYTVLAELYSNALEHGVMGLDSALKQDAAGFSEYYRQRDQRLSELDAGFVRFHLQIVPNGEGGRLLLRVEDSGEGFAVAEELARQQSPTSLGGRGMRLICRLADECTWDEDGRGVSVEFCWNAGA